MEVLYVYDHCPFCVKARMIFGLKQRPVVIKYLLNDDESTPISMIGQKMLPILEEDQHFMGESMDIVHKIDQIDGRPVLVGPSSPKLIAWLRGLDYINKLLIPRFVTGNMPEFATESAKVYFKQKKEAVFGSFELLLAETDQLMYQLNADLRHLETLILSPNACNEVLAEDDIHLFALLRGLSIVGDVSYPPLVDEYRKKMSELSAVPLYTIS